MSRLIDEYTRNKSPEDKKEVERRVREMAGTMSELSALMLVLEEMRQEGKKDGGEIKIKEKPLSPRQKALIDSANRIRKLEAAEERTKGITPKVKPKKPIVPKKKPINSKAIAKKYFTGVF